MRTKKAFVFVKNETVETVINDLIQLDIDASYAYEEAIKAIDVKEIQEHLRNFQDDHKRHVEELSILLKDLGGKPIKPSQDFKGYVIEGMTALRGITGTVGALKAMLINEEITNNKYAKALDHKGLFNRETRSLINDNYHDEKRHLAYIQKKIKELSQ